MWKILELRLLWNHPSLLRGKQPGDLNINVGTVEQKITESNNAPIPEMKLELKLSLKNIKLKLKNEAISEGDVVVEVAVVVVAAAPNQL
jgi:hypothetical protein